MSKRFFAACFLAISILNLSGCGEPGKAEITASPEALVSFGLPAIPVTDSFTTVTANYVSKSTAKEAVQLITQFDAVMSSIYKGNYEKLPEVTAELDSNIKTIFEQPARQVMQLYKTYKSITKKAAQLQYTKLKDNKASAEAIFQSINKKYQQYKEKQLLNKSEEDNELKQQYERSKQKLDRATKVLARTDISKLEKRLLMKKMKKAPALFQEALHGTQATALINKTLNKIKVVTIKEKEPFKFDSSSALGFIQITFTNKGSLISKPENLNKKMGDIEIYQFDLKKNNVKAIRNQKVAIAKLNMIANAAKKYGI